jgi:hypothetical protein
MSKARITELVLDETIVGEQQEALAVSVKSPRRIDIRHAHISLKRLLLRARPRAKLREHIKGLPQHEVAPRLMCWAGFLWALM